MENPSIYKKRVHISQLVNVGSFPSTVLAWRIIPVSSYQLWLVNPLTGVVPLPNGRTSLLINGGDPNYLRYLEWPSKWWLILIRNLRAMMLGRRSGFLLGRGICSGVQKNSI